MTELSTFDAAVERLRTVLAPLRADQVPAVRKVAAV